MNLIRRFSAIVLVALVGCSGVQFPGPDGDTERGVTVNNIITHIGKELCRALEVDSKLKNYVAIVDLRV